MAWWEIVVPGPRRRAPIWAAGIWSSLLVCRSHGARVAVHHAALEVEEGDSILNPRELRYLGRWRPRNHHVSITESRPPCQGEESTAIGLTGPNSGTKRRPQRISVGDHETPVKLHS